MKNKSTQQMCFWIVLFTFLSACGNPGSALSTGTPMPTVVSPTPIPPTATPTFTQLPVNVSPSPTPTGPVFPVITPDPIQVERWNEYEEALATAFFKSYFPPEKVVCEWEILGQADREVYVWAYCSGIYSAAPSSGSIPSVIHLEADGSVQSAEIPGSGTAYGEDIRRMFPPELHQRIFDHQIALEAMGDRIRWRRGHPEEPPLIILNSLSTQPTPVVMPWGTPDSVQVERWSEYESALAGRLDSLSSGTVLCEWEFLGRAGNEVYVWGICGSGGRLALEDIVRIDVNEDGSVQQALLNGPTIYPMLPPEAREKYFSGSIHFQELVDHLRWRFAHPTETPLIVLKAAP